MGILNETGFLGRYLPDWARIVGQMQFDTYHIFTVDEHTIEAMKVLNALERGELAQIAPVASSRGGSPAVARVAPRAVSGPDAARHRQGPRRRPFPDRRRSRAGGRARARPVGGGDRDGLLAGAAPSAAERDGVQARHRRSEDDPRSGRHDPVAGTAAAAASADRLRHARGVVQGLERLEGDAAARAVYPGGGGAGRRPVHHRTRCPRGARQGGGGRSAGGLDGRADRAFHLARLCRLLAVVRSGNACPPCPPGPRRGTASRAADGGHAARCRRAR